MWNGAEIVRGSTAVSTTIAELVWLTLLLILILVSPTHTQELCLTWCSRGKLHNMSLLEPWHTGPGRDYFPVWAVWGSSRPTSMSPGNASVFRDEVEFLHSKQMHLKKKIWSCWLDVTSFNHHLKNWHEPIRSVSLSTNPDKWSGSDNCYFWLPNILFDHWRWLHCIAATLSSQKYLWLCCWYTNIYTGLETVQFQLIYSCVSITVTCYIKAILLKFELLTIAMCRCFHSTLWSAQVRWPGSAKHYRRGESAHKRENASKRENTTHWPKRKW